MSKSLQYYSNWLEHHGKIVTVGNVRCQLRVTTYDVIYPYPDAVIDVYAEPINKNSKHYTDIKKKLGDDWTTDVLSSDIDVQCEILEQLV